MDLIIDQNIHHLKYFMLQFLNFPENCKKKKHQENVGGRHQFSHTVKTDSLRMDIGKL